MERIRAAIKQARESRDGSTSDLDWNSQKAPLQPPEQKDVWADLPRYKYRPDLLERNRIVTATRKDKAHFPFDNLRTRILSTCRQNGWKSVGITSPTASCGKTTVAINLAFSFARQKDSRIVLIDTDLRRPMVAQILGITGTQSMGRFLSGDGDIEDHFLLSEGNLALGTNYRHSLNSAEILQNAAAKTAMTHLHTALQPDILLADLPPTGITDDVMAFLPNLDVVLIIAAAGQSTIKDIDECERGLAEHVNVMGVVLNKCIYTPQDQNQGYY